MTASTQYEFTLYVHNACAAMQSHYLDMSEVAHIAESPAPADMPVYHCSFCNRYQTHDETTVLELALTIHHDSPYDEVL